VPVIINSPKNVLLKPLFVLLVILLTPLAVVFSVIRRPFAKRRIIKLDDTIQKEWLPRGKYIYIGFTSNFVLADYTRESILPKYERNIIYDEWDVDEERWIESEPDIRSRITTFWQDLGGDFDGDPLLIIATFSSKKTEVGQINENFHIFTVAPDKGYVLYNRKPVKNAEAGKIILQIIDTAVDHDEINRHEV
jgi:hypothetical protein